MLFEGVDCRRGGCKGPVAALVDSTGPRPRGATGDAETVAFGKSGDVGLVNRDGGYREPLGDGHSPGAEQERRRQMDDVGREGPHGRRQTRLWQADGE